MTRTVDAGDSAAMPVTLLKHELRTPINHIIGYSEILLEDLDTPRADRVARIRQIARELASVIDTVLSPARLNGGTTVSRESLLELRRVVEEAAARIRTIDVASGRADLPLECRSDLERIEEATVRLQRFAQTGILCKSE
jgi:signal transduction histidine kinase